MPTQSVLELIKTNEVLLFIGPPPTVLSLSQRDTGSHSVDTTPSGCWALFGQESTKKSGHWDQGHMEE